MAKKKTGRNKHKKKGRAGSQPREFGTFDDLLAELKNPGRAHIRLVKVEDQGLVEPVRQGNAIVMQPRVRIVATALDYETREILRWEKKWDVGGGRTTVDVFSGRPSYNDPTGEITRERITAALEARGFLVSEGEWTPDSAKAALESLPV